MLSRSTRVTGSFLGAIVISIGIPMASLAAPPASTPFMDSFPTQDHIVGLEPESSLCGFEISAEYSGTVAIKVFFDEAGDPKRLHVHITTNGSLSANGITLFSRSSRTQFFDFQASTVVEVGLVFQNAGPGTGVALMDRGRLVWSVDPDTGEWAFPPIFEAGPHPQLHGDVTGLCEALTP